MAAESTRILYWITLQVKPSIRSPYDLALTFRIRLSIQKPKIEPAMSNNNCAIIMIVEVSWLHILTMKTVEEMKSFHALVY